METRPALVRADLARIQPLRGLFLHEAGFQVRYHACHERGWTDSYVTGRVPAARCSVQNLGSRATLTKAGMRLCGFLLMGEALTRPPA
jgi:hypothetical protein